MKEWILDLAARLLTEADDVAQARSLGLAMAHPREAGASAYLSLCRLVGEAAEPAAAIAALDSTEADAGIRVGALIVHGFAAVRGGYRSQSDARAARDALSARAEASYPLIGEALGAAALDFAVRIVGEAVVQISRLPASMVPVVRVETAISLPSSLIAYDLYGEPARGGEIVARNKSATPMLMPVLIEALGV
ncbi:MAG: hypothetical protein LCH86_07715 [Proteobacteria bacterium]|nr:hypothetical protein [Pseudomonadota bacterium]